jgi:putative ABC transport system substrate-binding protein
MAKKPKLAKVPRVGILTPADSDKAAAISEFQGELEKLGFIDKETINLDFACAKGDNGALPGLAAKLLSQPAAVIVTDTTMATQAVVDVTKKIPIVQAAGGDPNTDLKTPSDNVTGFDIRPEQLSAKRLELLYEAFDSIACVTILLDLTNAITLPMLRVTAKAAANLGVRLQVLHAGTRKELSLLGSKAKEALTGSEGLIVFPGAMFWNHRDEVLNLAAAAQVPAIYPEREYADDGGLMAYGSNIPDTFRRAARYVARILVDKAKPGDLPIGTAKTDLVFNGSTAQRLQLSPSQSFLDRRRPHIINGERR